MKERETRTEMYVCVHARWMDEWMAGSMMQGIFGRMVNGWMLGSLFICLFGWMFGWMFEYMTWWMRWWIAERTRDI